MNDTVSKALSKVAQYQDAPNDKVDRVKWRPLKDVHEELGGLPEIPDHVHEFGDFMHKMAEKAAGKGLSSRDLIKAYVITRSSIRRQSRQSDDVRKNGLILPQSVGKTIRPEGAMAEWLKSQMGQRFLDAAEDGKVDPEAVAHAQKAMTPFGFKTEEHALPWAVQNLAGKHEMVSNLVKAGLAGISPSGEWRDFATKLHGIKDAKAGFVGSLLGRGDAPTLDARQVILNTGMSTKDVGSKLSGPAGAPAVERLAARQAAMNPRMDPAMEPFRQHLTHHAVWDKAANAETTHDDLKESMRYAANGGRIQKNGGGSASDAEVKHQMLLHAIAALGIPDHGLTNLNPDFVKALNSVSSPFSHDPKVVQKALAISQSLNPSSALNKKLTGGFYNIKQGMAPNAVGATVGNIPGVNTKAINPMTWDQFHQNAKGGTLINVGGDKTNLGRLTHINGKKLNWPVDLHAGPKYMLEPNPGAVWANSTSHTTAFNKKIREAAKKGDVYGVYSPMGAQSGDSAYHMFDALMAQIDKGSIDEKDAKEFDDALKRGEHAEDKKDAAIFAKAMENWPGIRNPKEAAEYARNLPGKHRSGVVKLMDKKTWMDKGFPKVGETRVAITDPDVMNMPGNMLGHRIVQFDPDKLSADETAFNHNTYKAASAGQYVGDVPPVQRQYAMPDVMEQITSNPKYTSKGLIVHPYSDQPTGRSSARKMFDEQKQLQPINDRMNDSINVGLQRQKEYGLKRGGKAKNIDRALSLTSLYSLGHDRDA